MPVNKLQNYHRRIKALLGGSAALSRFLVIDFLLFSISVVMGILIVESLFFHVLMKPVVPENVEQLSKYCQKLWPHSYATEKPRKIFRIIGLADSFGWAEGKQNYHALLESDMNRNGCKTEVINLSIPGVSPYYEYLNFVHNGVKFKDPDLVLLGVFIGNDFDDYFSKDAMIYRYASFPSPVPVEKSSFLPRILGGHFYSLEYAMVLNRVIKEEKLKESELELGLVSEKGSFSQKSFMQIEKGRLELCRKDNYIEKEKEKLLGILDMFKDKAEDLGVPLLIIIHPDQYQVERSLQKELAQRYLIDLEDYDLQRPQKILLEYCKKESIKCIDLLPDFRENGSEGGLYKLRDTHYNQAGNHLAAGIISKSILDDFGMR